MLEPEPGGTRCFVWRQKSTKRLDPFIWPLQTDGVNVHGSAGELRYACQLIILAASSMIWRARALT